MCTDPDGINMEMGNCVSCSCHNILSHLMMSHIWPEPSQELRSLEKYCVTGACTSVHGLLWQHPRMRGLCNRHALSHSSGACKSEVKVSVGLVPSERRERRVCSWPLSLDCRRPSSPCVSSLHLRSMNIHVCVQIPCLYKNASHIKLEAHPLSYALILTHYICNDHIST